MRRFAVLGLACALIAVPFTAKADGLDIGTIIGAGLGGLVGNQIGHGTGKMAATAVGVVTGGVIGHHVDNGWNSGSHRTSYSAPNTTYYAQPQPAYVPNYVAPYAPAPSQIVYTQNYGYADRDEDYRRHHHFHRHQMIYAQPVVQRVVVREAEPETVGYCREYTQRVNIGNHVEESYGTACQQPDGSWQIVK
jgi:uncharacterized protein YcfJ